MSGLGLTFLRRGNLANPIAGSDYIKFKDEEVFNILMSNGVSSDGVGITKDDAAKVTDIGVWFRSSVITSFNELQYFTSVTSLQKYAFHSCDALTSINLDNIEVIGAEAFVYCENLAIEVYAPNLREIGLYAFFGSGITGIKSLGSVSSLPDGKWEFSIKATTATFSKCKNLKYAMLNEGLKIIGYGTFAEDSNMEILYLPTTITTLNAVSLAECTSLKTIICRAETPPLMANANIFQSVQVSEIYVPDASVDAYKAASIWSSYASRIKPLSEYQG